MSNSNALLPVLSESRNHVLPHKVSSRVHINLHHFSLGYVHFHKNNNKEKELKHIYSPCMIFVHFFSSDRCYRAQATQLVGQDLTCPPSWRSSSSSWLSAFTWNNHCRKVNIFPNRWPQYPHYQGTIKNLMLFYHLALSIYNNGGNN